MKKYTIIYKLYGDDDKEGRFINLCERVLTSNLDELLKDEKFAGVVDFIFEGWPEHAGGG